jgi:hypothetical protein
MAEHIVDVMADRGDFSTGIDLVGHMPPFGHLRVNGRNGPQV